MFVDVLIDQPVRHALSYQITPEILPYITVGSLVEVPFGRKKSFGIVQSLKRRRPQTTANIRPVLRLLMSNWVQTETLRIAAALADHTGEPPGVCLFRLLPPAGKKLPVAQVHETQAAWRLSKRYHLIAPRADRFRQYLTMIRKAIRVGQQTLLIIPSAFVQELSSALDPAWATAIVDGSISATKQRAAANSFLGGTVQVLIGTRHIIGWPANSLRWLIVDDVTHPAHLDEQRPYADSATIAFIRHTVDASHLVLGTALPTAGMALAEQEHTAQRIRLSLPLTPITLRQRRFDPDEQSESAGPATLLIAPRTGLGGNIYCEQCDWVLSCANCHGELDIQPTVIKFRCYSCDQQTPRPTRCLSCHSSLIAERGIGVDAIRTQLERDHGAMLSTIHLGTESELETSAHYSTIIFLYADSPILSPRLDRPIDYVRSISEARGQCDHLSIQTKHPEQTVWQLLGDNAPAAYRDLLKRREQAQLQPYWRALSFPQPITQKQLERIRACLGVQSREMSDHGMIHMFIPRVRYATTVQKLRSELPTIRFRVDSIIDHA
ncbi:MAG: hypothetical protein AAB701_01875 [Patescibacteria group bacterium]